MFRDSDFHMDGESGENFYAKFYPSGAGATKDRFPSHFPLSDALSNKPCPSHAFPHIETIFDYAADHPNSELYTGAVRNILRKIMPPESFLSDNTIEEQKASLEALKISLPLF